MQDDTLSGYIYNFPQLAPATGNCDLCRENNCDQPQQCRPWVCRYCALMGGGLGIGSRSGSKQWAETMLTTVRKCQNPNLTGSLILPLFADEWGFKCEFPNRAAIRGKQIYHGSMYGFLKLPKAVTKEWGFCTWRDGCMAPKFEPEWVDEHTIKLHKGDPLDPKQPYSLGAFHLEPKYIGVFLGKPKKGYGEGL